MDRTSFERTVGAEGAVPLAWVGAARQGHSYVNVGDALSPVMVALVSGRPVRRAGFASSRHRMSAVGTVGQSLCGGTVEVWGTGSSPWANPLERERRPYRPPAGTVLRLHATRGPHSAALLSGGRAAAIPYGDPAALLPRFYAPAVEKRWELGVVLHLSELADRSFAAVPKPGLERYRVPGDLAVAIRLVTMVGPPGAEGVRAKIDELLACRRVVSTSLHGIALAEAYGIPCLYLGSAPGEPGLRRIAFDDPAIAEVNARFPDLYAGMGRRDITFWRQRKLYPTDWEALIAAIDRHWEPVSPDLDALAEACPAGCAPLRAAPGATVWDHPLIRFLPFDAKEAA